MHLYVLVYYFLQLYNCWLLGPYHKQTVSMDGLLPPEWLSSATTSIVSVGLRYDQTLMRSIMLQFFIMSHHLFYICCSIYKDTKVLCLQEMMLEWVIWFRKCLEDWSIALTYSLMILHYYASIIPQEIRHMREIICWSMLAGFVLYRRGIVTQTFHNWEWLSGWVKIRVCRHDFIKRHLCWLPYGLCLLFPQNSNFELLMNQQWMKRWKW